MEKRLRQEWQQVAGSRRVVVKIGSNLLTAGGSTLDQAWIAARCREVEALIQEGRQVVIVTSGAVAAGRPRLNLGRPLISLREKQAAAAAGQGFLMRCYEEAFASLGRHVGQILLTRDDVAHRRRYLNARDTLETLLQLGLVPIVNENDSVVVAEIRFGDNDTLAALVAGLIQADLLILLSDVDGLCDANPRFDATARRIPLVERVTPELEALAGGAGTSVGSGGMATKLRAARKAARSGCRTVLANGFRDDPIRTIFHGEPLGTLFLAESDAISSRKRWIADGLLAEGELILDQGATHALLSGRSLLAKGIRDVVGNFDRGDAVYCSTPQGEHTAKGLVNYNADDLRRIVGRHSAEFEKILGFIADEEIIHRNDMVILQGNRI
ncbi:MAG: glutamate 5-kinase [Magnetococcales bacterium]|nr:glutamate 5-kinase [Magnetococcales bacterium]MBF0323069.1 glutamate 5-kinase [Magnetococcales bacterium]